MSFGDDTPQLVPPPLPPPPPTAPTFASGTSKFFKQGRPLGGTLITNPLAPATPTPVARKTLMTS